MMLPILMLLLLLLNTSNSFPLAKNYTDQYDCFNSSTYTPHRSFEANLNNLLTTLVVQISTTTDGFFKHKQGSDNDTNPAYGLVLCRGDLNSSDCHDCVQMASKEVRQYCPRARQAILWKEKCMLRYSNESFFNHLQEKPYKLLHDEDITDNIENNWIPLFYDTFKAVRSSVAASNNYATKEAWFPPLQKTLYMLAQCSPDLTVRDCQKCLDDINYQFLSKCLGRISLTPSCMLRYELYPFYDETSSNQKTGNRKVFVMKLVIAILAPLVFIGLLIAFGTYQFRRKAKKYSCRDREIKAGVDRLPSLPEGDESSRARVEAILQIPEEDRTFSTLKEERLLSLGEADQSVEQSTEIKEEVEEELEVKSNKVEEEVNAEREEEEEIPLVRRSKRNSSRRLDFSGAQQEKIYTINDSDDEDSASAMSNTPKSNLAPSFQELRERAKKQKIGNLSVVPLPASSQVHSAVVPIVTMPMEPAKPINLSFPANFCNFEGGTKSVKPELNQLLFPAAKEYLMKFKPVDVLTEAAATNFQTVQSILTVREHLGGLERQLSVHRNAEKGLKEKVMAQEALIQKLSDNNKKLVEYAEKKRAEVLDAAAYYAVKTRSEFMQEYKDGKAGEWSVEEDRTAFEELYGQASPPGADDGFDLKAFLIDVSAGKDNNKAAGDKVTSELA